MRKTLAWTAALLLGAIPVALMSEVTSRRDAGAAFLRAPSVRPDLTAPPGPGSDTGSSTPGRTDLPAILKDLLDRLDALGLNDPDSPVRFERPLRTDSPGWMADTVSRLATDGIVSLVDLRRGRGLGFRADQLVARVLRGDHPPLSLAVVRSERDASGGVEMRLQVRNVSHRALGTVSVHLIASILEGQDGFHAGPVSPDGTGDEAASPWLRHSFRLVDGSLSNLAIGDLAPGSLAETSADFRLETGRFQATHLYFLVVYRDEDGALHTAVPLPVRPIPNASAPDGSSPTSAAHACLP